MSGDMAELDDYDDDDDYDYGEEERHVVIANSIMAMRDGDTVAVVTNFDAIDDLLGAVVNLTTTEVHALIVELTEAVDEIGPPA